jgi:hypothetical protein
MLGQLGMGEMDLGKTEEEEGRRRSVIVNATRQK